MSEAPGQSSLGRWQVELGHGHRRDPWNGITPATLARALDTGARVALPPGSQLVLKVLNRFKEGRVAGTGAVRYPLVDLLKPETPAVPLLLLYLDPRLVLPEQFLAPRAGPWVLITGHTHAARRIVLDGERVYLNTGTWTDLMRLPPLDDDAAVQKLAEDLEAGNVPWGAADSPRTSLVV